MEISIVSPFEFEKVLSNEDPTLDEEFTQEKYLEKVPTNHKDILTKFSENAKGKLNIFPSTKLLPSYLFCFVAGPYKQLKCQETYRVSYFFNLEYTHVSLLHLIPFYLHGRDGSIHIRSHNLMHEILRIILWS